MLLIQNAHVFAPQDLGVQDVLIIGKQIVQIAPQLNAESLPFTVKTMDATGLTLTPGFVDGHQHFTGGGGEGGYTSKVPEMTIEMNTLNGVTTAVGLLGTDALSRSVENLYAKTQAFNEQGITARMLTGSYWHPSPTITGNIARDLAFIEMVIGLKLAISDHRGPYLQTTDIARLAAEVRLAALIAKKPGFITLHTGGLNNKLSQIIELVRDQQFAAHVFLPTHINRHSLLEDVKTLVSMGVSVDATAMNHRAPSGKDKMNAADLLKIARTEGWLDRLCISSDAGGSLPIWNADLTQMIGMGVGTPESLLFELQLAVRDLDIPLSEVLPTLTINPAKIYGFVDKGRITPAADADVLLLDTRGNDWRVVHVIANGKLLVENQQVINKAP